MEVEGGGGGWEEGRRGGGVEVEGRGGEGGTERWMEGGGRRRKCRWRREREGKRGGGKAMRKHEYEEREENKVVFIIYTAQDRVNPRGLRKRKYGIPGFLLLRGREKYIYILNLPPPPSSTVTHPLVSKLRPSFLNTTTPTLRKILRMPSYISRGTNLHGSKCAISRFENVGVLVRGGCAGLLRTGWGCERGGGMIG